MGIIAIFGGTFNPIHNGHIEIINEVLSIPDVERVLVIPTKIPPHKTVNYIADETDRLAMCKLAVGKLANVEISDIELKRQGKSYTIDTLKTLKELFPQNDLAITIGADMVVTFDEWKDFKTIISSARIITFSRVGTDFSDYFDGISFLRDHNADIYMVDRKISNISSSQIRDLLSNGNDASALIPDEVIKYIIEKNLYGVNNDR